MKKKVNVSSTRSVHKREALDNTRRDGYRNVEILRPVVKPSVDLAKITEAVRYVMDDKSLNKK